MTKKPAITIFGTGAVGSALQDFFESEKFRIQSVWNRTEGFLFDETTQSLKTQSSTFPNTEAHLGDWIFISTPDDQISTVSEKLSELSVNWTSKLVIHNSGSLSSSECKSLADKGAKTVSMHPIQTFKKGDGKSAFQGIYISLEGDEEGRVILKPIVKAMQANLLLFTPEQKQVMHASAVFASNYLVALLNSAEQLLVKYEIEDGLDILKPLISQTIQNIFNKGVQKSLTGPILRGDSNTISSHLNLLSKHKQTEELYKLLGLEALSITRTTGKLDEHKLNLIENLLRSQSS